MASAGLKLHLEPRYLFQSVIPPALLTEPRRPPGIIPDAAGEATLLSACTARNARRPAGEQPLRRVYLFNVKTVHAGGSIYSLSRGRDPTRGVLDPAGLPNRRRHPGRQWHPPHVGCRTVRA